MSRSANKAGFRSVPRWTRPGFTGDLASSRAEFELETQLRYLARGLGRVVTPGPNTNLRAILEGSPAGSVIRLGEGVFTVLGPISITKEVHIIGTGRATKIVMVDDPTAVVPGGFQFSSTATNCSLRMLSIETQTGEHTTSGTDTVFESIDFSGSSAVQLFVGTLALRATMTNLRFSATAGTDDIYLSDGATGAVICGVHPSARTNALNYRGIDTPQIACIQGTINVR